MPQLRVANQTNGNGTRPKPPLDVAVIIVSWNVRHYLAECLKSVLADFRHSNLLGKIWLVDNASTDGSVDLVETLFQNVEVIANRDNLGFGAANNQGMRAAAADNPRHYLLLNPDTVVRPGAIGHMVGWMDINPEVGMVGSRLVYGDGRLQHSAFHFPGLRQLLFEFLPFPLRFYNTALNGRYAARKFNKSFKPFKVDHPLGAAMLVRRNVADATGGFDEAFHMYCEEIDWAWRITLAGWEIYTVPSAEIVHFGGESTKQIPAASIINLWKSRHQLYSKYYTEWHMRFAKLLVQNGLERRAIRAPTTELTNAYRKAASFWK
ncbi:MAG: glycosyltransferase family 2 protein [Candidatus Promineifilaceae bacterium]